MIVTPSNWVIKTHDDLAIRLLDILPSKVETIVNDLLSGVKHRSNSSLIDRLFSWLGEQGKKAAKNFGKKILVNGN